MSKPLLSLTLLLLAILTACGGPSPLVTPAVSPDLTLSATTAVPTIPLLVEPSATASTGEVTATLPSPPSDTPVPLLPAVLTLTPTATPQLSPVLASGAIQVLAPGPLSKVLSPIHLRGYVIPGYRNLVRIELYGEDGRLMVRKLSPLYTEFKWAYLSMDITFETHAAAELGRLQISVEDQDERVIALTSVHLLLLPEGFDEINPPGKLDERCVIFLPLAGFQAGGGNLSVAGKVRPFNSQPLIIELTIPGGNVVGTRLVSVTPAVDDSYITFSTDVPYTVFAATEGRLSVRQLDDRIPGTMYLYSQEILLSP